jgi:hypothetical protein
VQAAQLRNKRVILPPWNVWLTSCSAYSSARSSETSVNFYRIKQVTSQETLLSIVTALRASNSTWVKELFTKVLVCSTFCFMFRGTSAHICWCCKSHLWEAIKSDEGYRTRAFQKQIYHTRECSISVSEVRLYISSQPKRCKFRCGKNETERHRELLLPFYVSHFTLGARFESRLGHRTFRGMYDFRFSQRSVFWDITVCRPLEFNRRQPQAEFPCLACYLLHAGFFLGLFFDREAGGDMFLRNVDFKWTTRRYIPEDTTILFWGVSWFYSVLPGIFWDIILSRPRPLLSMPLSNFGIQYHSTLESLCYYQRRKVTHTQINTVRVLLGR